MRRAWVLCVLAFSAVNAPAQEAGCMVTLPVSVYLPNGALVRKLEQNQFEVKSKQGAAGTVTVSTERGPRRIVFVVETGKRPNKSARMIEAEVIRGILANAREEDSFGLVTAGGPKNEVKLGTSREELEKAANGLAGEPKGSGTGLAMPDAIEEAGQWLEPGKAGDAIVVLGMGIEFEHSRTGFKKLRDTLSAGDIRVFGFQLGMIVAGTVYTGVGALPGGPGFIPRAYVAPNEESLNALSVYSGGFFFVEDTENPDKKYKLTDDRSRVLVKGGEQIYKAIQEYYVLRIEKAPKDYQVDVSEEVKQKLPQVLVSYPRKKESCQEKAAR